MLLARNRYQEAAAAAGTIALGCTIECAQHAIYLGGIEYWDMRDDAYAALAAFAVMQVPGLQRMLVREGG
jgi:hypothetical protein